MDFTYAEAKNLLELFGDPDPDDADMTISVIESGRFDASHSGPGKYAYFTDYPDEGSHFLGKPKHEKEPAVQADACKCDPTAVGYQETLAGNFCSGCGKPRTA